MRDVFISRQLTLSVQNLSDTTKLGKLPTSRFLSPTLRYVGKLFTSYWLSVYVDKFSSIINRLLHFLCW